MPIGTLYEIAACTVDGSCAHSLAFESLDGEWVEDVENAAGAPFGKLIEASFSGSRLVNYEESPYQSAIDERRKNIALIRFARPGHGTDSDHLAAAEKAARELEDRLRLINESGNHQWEEISVTPYFLFTDKIRPGPAGMNFGIVGDELRAQNPDEWDRHTYWQTWGGSVSGSAVGLASVGGRKSWGSAAGDLAVLLHEILHCLGCYHSSTPTQEYRPHTCTMGTAKNTGLCLPQLARIKQVRESHIVQSEAGRRYFIVPAEVNDNDLRQGEVKGVFIEEPAVSTGWLMLSARKTRDQSRLGSGSESLVYLDETRLSFGYTPITRGEIREGQTRTIGGVPVTHHGTRDGVIEVEVGNAPPEPFPEPLPMGPADVIDDSHSGIWHNPEYAHQGVFLIVDGDKAQGYWYTHYARGERRAGLMTLSSNLWLVLDGEIDRATNTFRFDVTQMVDGKPIKVGHGTIQRKGEEILMRSYTELFGRDSMRLPRLTAEPTGPVRVSASSPDDGYTFGKFGKTHVAVHFHTGHRSEMKWEIHMGNDAERLPGWQIESAFKRHFSDQVRQVSPIDLTKIGEA